MVASIQGISVRHVHTLWGPQGYHSSGYLMIGPQAIARFSQTPNKNKKVLDTYFSVQGNFDLDKLRSMIDGVSLEAFVDLLIINNNAEEFYRKALRWGYKQILVPVKMGYPMAILNNMDEIGEAKERLRDMCVEKGYASFKEATEVIAKSRVYSSYDDFKLNKEKTIRLQDLDK